MPIRNPITKMKNDHKHQQGYGGKGLLVGCCGNVNYIAIMENTKEVPQKTRISI
jgi:hypothetical protein